MRVKETKRLHPNIVALHDTKSNMLLPHHVTENGYIPATEYFIQKENQSNEIDFSKYPKIIHVVNEGEWLWKIARFYWGEDEDVMLNQVVSRIRIDNDLISDTLTIGEQLTVPIRLEQLKEKLKDDNLWDEYKKLANYDAQTTLNPSGIELEKPDQCLIVETANQIISKIKANLNIFNHIDVTGFLFRGTFMFVMGASLKGGLIYIEDDGLYLLLSIEGGIGDPDISWGIEIISGEATGRTATADDIRGLSYNKGEGIFILNYGESHSIDVKKLELVEDFMLKSLGITCGGLKAFSFNTKGLTREISGSVTVGYTHLFKIF